MKTEKRIYRRGISIIAALALVLGLSGTVTMAATAPTIEDVEYKGSGKVEVEFYGDVEWKKAKVSVRDSKGKSYKAVILKKDDDEIKFRIKKYKKNRSYRFTISGVREEYSGSSYTSVKGKVSIPKAGVVQIKDVDYDAEDSEVEFEFKGKVSWTQPVVKITDSKGKNHVVKIKKKDNDEIGVRVKGLVEGQKYSYKITGVKARGAKDGTTVKGSFRAYND